MASTVEQPSIGKSSFWRFPAGQDLGHALFMIGLGLALYGLFTIGYPNFFIPLICAVLGAVLLERGATKWFTPPKLGDMPQEEMAFDPLSMVPSDFSEDADVSNLMQAAYNFSDTLTPVQEMFTRDDDGVLDGFGFTSSTVGFFAKEATKKAVMELFTSFLDGPWGIDFNTKTNTVIGSRRSSIPKIALPEIWNVVRSPEEAGTAFLDFEMVLGPGENGKVTFSPQVFPHVAVIATSGGGKSIFLKAAIEQARATGGQIILGDGKGSDYSLLRNQPGVICIGRGSGTKALEYAGAIEIGFRIMQQRQDTSAERKAANPDGWENVPPVFIILDELKSVLKKWKTELDAKSFAAIESKVNQILALGRQHRILVYTASQDAYAESIPFSWLTNIGMKISLGKPHHVTLSKAFDESIRGDATRIAAGIDPNVRGRGMIAGIDEDSGTAAVVAYQGFIGPSPGEPMPKFLNDEQRAQWRKFEDKVTNAIPNMYSRKWFKITEKPEAQIKMEKEMNTDFGFIDFELFSVNEVAALPIINLDMRDANGNIVPNPEMVKYDPDPMNPLYVCKRIVNTANSIQDI